MINYTQYEDALSKMLLVALEAKEIKVTTNHINNSYFLHVTWELLSPKAADTQQNIADKFHDACEQLEFLVGKKALKKAQETIERKDQIIEDQKKIISDLSRYKYAYELNK